MHEQKDHLFPVDYFGPMLLMLDTELDEVLDGGDGEDGGDQTCPITKAIQMLKAEALGVKKIRVEVTEAKERAARFVQAVWRGKMSRRQLSENRGDHLSRITTRLSRRFD